MKLLSILCGKVKKVKPGNTLGDIGNVIQKYAENFDTSSKRFLYYGIVRFHCAPNILHYGEEGQGRIKRRNDIYYRTND